MKTRALETCSRHTGQGADDDVDVDADWRRDTAPVSETGIMGWAHDGSLVVVSLAGDSRCHLPLSVGVRRRDKKRVA